MSQMGYVETNLSFEESSDFCNDKCGQMFQTLMLETQLHNADADATTYCRSALAPLGCANAIFSATVKRSFDLFCIGQC